MRSINTGEVRPDNRASRARDDATGRPLRGRAAAGIPGTAAAAAVAGAVAGADAGADGGADGGAGTAVGLTGFGGGFGGTLGWSFMLDVSDGGLLDPGRDDAEEVLDASMCVVLLPSASSVSRIPCCTCWKPEGVEMAETSSFSLWLRLVRLSSLFVDQLLLCPASVADTFGGLTGGKAVCDPHSENRESLAVL